MLPITDTICRRLALLCLIGLASCATPSTFLRERCSNDLLEIVDRYEAAAIDTIVAISITGSPMTAAERSASVRTCGLTLGSIDVDSVTAEYAVPSKMLPCLSRLPWVERIVLIPAPLPLPDSNRQ
ncbi:MAG: hypothetical protein FGM24_05640 [Candidatus Kapabacteria bacterium]|nr:hypothetical protein [Candidatus Kapabacteria bacterium]